MKIAAMAFALVCLLAAPVQAESSAEAIQAAIDGSHRSAANRARDIYRHPRETLEFLGLQPGMTVVEMWPGSGWYTEILAHVLKDRGTLYAAQYSPNPNEAYQRSYYGAFLALLGQTPELYRRVRVTTFYPPYDLGIAPPGSADMVLTFRNLHNWIGDQRADGVSATLAFRAMYDVLKPGGILGITDHRWPEESGDADPFNTGYMKTSEAIALAERPASGCSRNRRSTPIRAIRMTTNRACGHCHPGWRSERRTRTATSLSASQIASR